MAKKKPQETPRMKFIPAVRDKIREGLGSFVREETLTRALDQWDAGEEPGGMVIGACFEYFRSVQTAIESHEHDEPTGWTPQEMSDARAELPGAEDR